MDLPQPVVPFRVMKGQSYWAAMGDTKWSAVKITSLKRVWAKADRVNPSSDEVTTRGARVKVAELVKRDPSLKGKDKPKSSPAKVFADVRRVKLKVTEQKREVVELPKPTPKPTERVGKLPSERLVELLALLGDDSTTDDW